MRDPNYQANLQKANQMAKEREAQLNSNMSWANATSGLLKGVGDTAAFGLHRLSPLAENNVTQGEGRGYASGILAGLLAPSGLAKGLGWAGSKLGWKGLANFGKGGSPMPVNRLWANPKIEQAAAAVNKAETNASGLAHFVASNAPRFRRAGIPTHVAPSEALQNAVKAHQRSKVLYPAGAAIVDGGINQALARILSKSQGDGFADGIPGLDQH